MEEDFVYTSSTVGRSSPVNQVQGDCMPTVGCDVLILHHHANVETVEADGFNDLSPCVQRE